MSKRRDRKPAAPPVVAPPGRPVDVLPAAIVPPAADRLMPEARDLLAAVDHLFATGGYLPPTLAPLARDYNQALRVAARAAK